MISEEEVRKELEKVEKGLIQMELSTSKAVSHGICMAYAYVLEDLEKAAEHAAAMAMYEFAATLEEK